MKLQTHLRLATTILCLVMGTSALAMATSGVAIAQSAAHVLSAEQEQKIADMLAESGAPSVSIAIVEQGKVVYAKAFGNASLSPDRPADVHTRYAIGSVSKQFTAAGILLMMEQGKLSLDDKVSKFFPDLTRANEITIRQLLSHTSGYSDYAPQDYIIPEWTKPTTADAILNEWAKKPLDFDPGTRWQYSNTNYVLAGRILEKASGEPLMEFLRKHFFDPLGIHSAGDCGVDKTPEDAVAYTRYALGPARPALREGPGWYFAAGELCMTPSDLALWDVAFLHKQILDARSYGEFTREVRLANGNATHYALGLQLGEMDAIPRISHGGEVSGFLALNAVFPTRDAAVVVLSNQDAIELIGPIGSLVSKWMLEPESLEAGASGASTTAPDIQQVRGILEGLMQGRVERQLFTSNMNFYYTDVALHDIQSSLAPLGALKSVTRRREALRGGMTFRAYTAQFDKKALTVTVYLTPDGHYEQFLIEEAF
jgi:D-alanyl-D-alanine carboxypeptidase